MSVPSDINEWLSWVQGTTVNDIVIDYSSNKLITIKDFTFCEITVAALWQFCVHHQITAYKNKTKEMTGALIIQYARTKSITDALYPCSKEDGKDEDVTEDGKLKNKKGKTKRHKSTAYQHIYGRPELSRCSQHWFQSYYGRLGQPPLFTQVNL